MKKKLSTFETIVNIILKIFLLCFSPFFFIVLALFVFFSWVIDYISKKEDEEHLKSSEVRKRDTDRKNARWHSYKDLIKDYFKFIFS